MKFPITHSEQNKENHVKGLKRPTISKDALIPVKLKKSCENRRLSKVESPYCGIQSTQMTITVDNELSEGGTKMIPTLWKEDPTEHSKCCLEPQFGQLTGINHVSVPLRDSNRVNIEHIQPSGQL